MSEFVIITGLSGAGRSQAADTFEDLGWFVIDNLPAALISKVAELVESPGSTTERVALVVGPGTNVGELLKALDGLRSPGSVTRVLYLEATDEVLVRRYEDTKRRHPQAASEGVLEGIEREREVLAPVREVADEIVDTSTLNVHELKARLHQLFAPNAASTMRTSITSFGYKYGLPLDVDLVFDCRFLANPHWVDDLRPRTGLDSQVREYVLEQPGASEFIERLDGLLELLVPAFEKEGKAYLRIAVGCTGGRHRSVVMGEEIGRMLNARGVEAKVSHRDVRR